MATPVASLLTRARSISHFGIGLKKLGFQLAERPKNEPAPEDVLVIWNRLPTVDSDAARYEAAGAKVIVCEHGWVKPEKFYAICRNHHNGYGTWRVGRRSRWPDFGIGVKPWRTNGEHILVIPQRGMGVPPVAMPRNWLQDVLPRLAKVTDRPIKVRYPEFRIHPIEPEFEGAHAIVTWASGGGIKAIVEGYPVFYEMPGWIGAFAARPGLEDLERPYLGERDTMFHQMSWAMWTAEEIERGEPFECLLQ